MLRDPLHASRDDLIEALSLARRHLRSTLYVAGSSDKFSDGRLHDARRGLRRIDSVLAAVRHEQEVGR